MSRTTQLCWHCHRDPDTLEKWCMVLHKWVEKCPKEDNDYEEGEDNV